MIIFGQVEIGWAAAAPQVAAILATICTAICAVVSLYIRTKAAGLERRVAECEKKCSECEEQREADQAKFSKELADRDSLLNTEWPSNDFDSRTVAEKILDTAKLQGIKITMAQVSRMIQNVRERRRNGTAQDSEHAEEFLP